METLREQAPSSYLVKLVGFSEVILSHKPYESAAFNASGHKWRLIFHPAGKEGEVGKDHVSIYARIDDVAASDDWEVNVELKFFIYNHNIKKYSVFQDGATKHYNKANKEWGFAKMLTCSKFNDPENGYVDGDACIVGVEIFVIKPYIEKVERVVFTQNPPNNKFTWKISEYSKIGEKIYHFSDEFVVGERKWKMKIYKERETVSVYVHAMGYLPNAVVSSTYAMLKIRLLNQKNSNHVEKSVFHFYLKENEGSGANDLVSVKVLNDESKGYLVEDTIVVEALLTCVTSTTFVDSI